VLRFEAHSVQVVRLGDVIKSDAAESGKRTKSDAKAEAKDSEPDLVDIDSDLRVSVSGLPKSVDGALKDRIDHFNKLPREQKVEQIIAGTTRYGPYAVFVLLPAFAALLKIAYLGRRRCPGRPRLYGEHLVFAAHNHAFLFAVGALLFVVPVTLVRQLVAVWIFVYLVWSMRAVYASSWLGIVVRGFVLAVVYFVLFAAANIALLVAAILLR
jgi:hypothetical protein